MNLTARGLLLSNENENDLKKKKKLKKRKKRQLVSGRCKGNRLAGVEAGQERSDLSSVSRGLRDQGVQETWVGQEASRAGRNRR